jgi:site-specific DNA-methyltransferase (adenine-specific)
MDASLGSASRFFPTFPPDTTRFLYCSKADRAERGEGNTWPVVKPLALMRWLIRLVVPPQGVILEPFGGSGTTLLAARAEGRRVIACEQDPEACEITRRRLDDTTLPLFQ